MNPIFIRFNKKAKRQLVMRLACAVVTGMSTLTGYTSFAQYPGGAAAPFTWLKTDKYNTSTGDWTDISGKLH